MHEAIERMERLTEEKQATQLRKDGTSNALHVARVRTILVEALTSAEETPGPEKFATLACAALGHDLLEDTDVTAEEIEQQFGPDTKNIIVELTNTGGDAVVLPFVAQVCAASEEARLIKYADLCDNILHASYDATLLQREWFDEYFLPIVDPMRDAIDAIPFTRYPRTGALLKNMARVARTHLEESLGSL